MFFRKRLRAQDGGAGAAGRRAALQARQQLRETRRFHDLVDGHLGAEDGLVVVHGMLARLGANLREGLVPGAVLVLVRDAGAREHLERHRRFGIARQFVGQADELIERPGAVVPDFG